MEPVERDVYVSCREPSGAHLAGLLSEGLVRRGFRVVPRGGESPEGVRDVTPALQAIEDAPDFVLVLTPGCLDGCADDRDPLRAEIAHALRTERNIVPVMVRGYEHPESLPPDLDALRTRPPVVYSNIRREESIARVAHRLSSDATVDERHMMRHASRIGLGVGALLVLLLAIAAVRTLPGMVSRYLGSRPYAPMTLYWSAFGQRQAGGRWTEFAIKDGSPMVAGDQFRLMFSTSAEGFAYVVSRDLRGEVSVLFPGRALKGGSRVRAGQVLAAPADGGWWTLDEDAGIAEIYVFASYDSIENLESLSDDREESSAERRAQLDSTIEGLLDGKHGTAPLRVRTRTGRLVLRSLAFRPAVLTVSATLASGTSVTHTLEAEQGLLSAMVEIRVGPAK